LCGKRTVMRPYGEDNKDEVERVEKRRAPSPALA